MDGGFALDYLLYILGQGFIGHVLVAEAGVPARWRQLPPEEHAARGRFFGVGIIVVPDDLAAPEAFVLLHGVAVFIQVVDDGDFGILGRPGLFFSRLVVEGLGGGRHGLSEDARGVQVLLLGHLLIPEQQDQMLRPCVAQGFFHLIGHGLGQIDASDLSTQSASRRRHFQTIE